MKNLFIAASLIVMFAIGTTHVPGISREGMAVIGIGAGCLLLWNFVSLEWPSLLCLAALALFSGQPYQVVFASGLGNWIIPFLLSCFLIGHVLNEEGFIKRLAIFFITNRAARKNPQFFVMFFLFGALFMSILMSPTVILLVFCSIAEKVFETIGHRKGDKFPAMLVTALVITVNIGSSMTPLGHAIPMLAISFAKIFAGADISFVVYSKFGIMIGIIVFGVFLGILRFFFLRELPDFSNFDYSALKSELAPMSKREKSGLIVFGLVIAMWLFPGVTSVLSPAFATLLISAGGAVPPMIGVIVLSILVIDGRPLLDFKSAIKDIVPWSTLLLLAATLALGSALTRPEIGVVDVIVSVGIPWLESTYPFTLLLAVVTCAVLFSNLMVNSLSVTVVSAIAIPLAVSSEIVTPGALAALIGVASSMAFATPPVSGPSAIAALSGWYNQRTTFILGGGTALAFIPVILLFGYPLSRLIVKV